MNQSVNRGFSLVELLITCAVLAIIAAIVFMAYGNLAKNAQLVVQDKDQAALYQLMTVFQGTGGNFAILPTLADADAQAAALTALLQGVGTDAGIQTIKGTSAKGLSADMRVIPDPNSNVADAHARIYIDQNNKVQLINKAVPSTAAAGGFLVVNKNLGLGQAYIQAHPGVDRNALYDTRLIWANTDTSGTKFADANAYIWNEDGNAYKRPDAIGTDQGTGGQQIISSYLTVTISIDPSEIPDLSSCTYWQYMAGHLGLKIARFDANDNSPLDIDNVSTISKVTAQIGTGPVLSLTNFISSTDAGGRKILVSDSAHPTLLSNVLPPANWTNSADTLVVTAIPKDLNTAAGSANADIAVKQLDLRLDFVNSDSDGVFSGSDSIKFSVTKDSSGHAITAADGIVGGIALTDKGGSTVTETYDANSLTDTITP